MDETQRDTNRDWEKLLDPDVLKANLVRASLYLASYELLKSAVIENPRGFINMGHTDPGADGPE